MSVRSQASPPSEEPPRQKGDSADSRKEHRGRNLAEWVSLGLSILLILGIGGYLLVEALRTGEPYVVAEAQLQFDRMVKKDETYILPMEVRNKGEHALRELKVQVTYTPPEGKEETRDIDLSYLGESSSQTMYLYFKDDPKTLNVKAEPQVYNLD